MYDLLLGHDQPRRIGGRASVSGFYTSAYYDGYPASDKKI